MISKLSLKLNDNNDLELNPQGQLVQINNKREEILQDIACLLQTVVGEVFGKPDYGMNVIKLFSEDWTMEQKTNEIERALTSSKHVVKVLYITSFYDKIRRQAGFNARVLCNELGETSIDIL